MFVCQYCLAYSAAQEHVETRIWNFQFLSVFSAKLRQGRISAVVTGGGIRQIIFLSFANSFNETTSILEGRVVKVPHSTRTTILQLVLPLRNMLRPEFGIFSFCQFFSAKLRLGRISAVVTGGGIREILFLRLAIFLMKLILEHTDIPATTHLGLPNLCTKSSKRSVNRYEIDK